LFYNKDGQVWDKETSLKGNKEGGNRTASLRQCMVSAPSQTPPPLALTWGGNRAVTSKDLHA